MSDDIYVPWSNRRWVGDDLWNLLYLPPKDLRVVYPGHQWSTLKSKRKIYRRKVKAGEIMAPRRSEDYPGPQEEAERAKARREALKKPLGQRAIADMISMESRKRLHDQLDEIIDNTNLPPEHVDSLRIKKISHWDMGYKDNDGEAQSHPLYGIQLEADPVKFEPEWPPVTRVESIKLRKKERAVENVSKRAVILPDLQIPYHDEKAVEVALKIVRDVKPDKIIILGDGLDLEQFSKFDNVPLAKEFANSVQGAIIRFHQLLVELRKIAPTAEIVVMEGNHDIRLTMSVVKNNMAAFGLRKATAPEGWPVLSVPYLCAFDTLDVEYSAGYPANRYWINRNLQVRHGNKVRSGGSTARVVSDDERVSTIFGHVHRLEMQYKTHHTYEGGKTNAAWGIGCLCKLDGSVPSRNRGVDLAGKPVENYENWQQAIAVVEYEDGDSPFNVTPVYINTFNNYQAIYNGRKYEASQEG